MTCLSIAALTPWSIYMPVQVIFGEGMLSRLPAVTSTLGKRALMVTGPNVSQLQPVQHVTEELRETMETFTCYDRIDSEPTAQQVDEIAHIAHEQMVQVIIGLGGGSPMDAAKAAGVITAQGGTAEDYLSGHRRMTETHIPVITVPTTAGTGAEVSKGAILTWREKKIKSGLRGTALFAHQAIIDPSLTSFLPSAIVAVTGFDVFCHAVETFVSKAASPVTTCFSLNTIESVCAWLPRLLENPQDVEARSQLSLHSMMMGFNLANSTTCLPHRLQYPLGALTNTPHAVGLAALYPAWCNLILNAAPEKASLIAERIFRGLRLAALPDKGSTIVDGLTAFMKQIQLHQQLSDLGVDESMCDEMAVMVSGNLQNDPSWNHDFDIAGFYRRAL